MADIKLGFRGEEAALLLVSIQLVDELIRAKWLTPVVTHTGAPKHKIVRTRGTHPDWAHAETVVQEGPDLIQSLAKSKHYLIIVYNTGVARRLTTYHLATGEITEIKRPFQVISSSNARRTVPDRYGFLDISPNDLHLPVLRPMQRKCTAGKCS